MFATGLALLSNAFHGRDRGTAFGVFGAVTGVAVAVGPVLGGALDSGLSWRWIFLVNIPVGIVALVHHAARGRGVARPARRAASTGVGLVTFSAGLAALVYGLIRSNEDGWGSGTVVGSLVAAAVLLVAFVIAEARAARADVRPLAVPQADVRRRADRRVRDLRVAVLGRSRTSCSTCRAVLGLSAIEIGVRFLVLSRPDLHHRGDRRAADGQGVAAAT